MAQKTVNPYYEIGGYIPTGLDSIITALGGGGASIEDLVNQVYAYIQPIFYPSPSTQVSLEIVQIARTAINSYVNSLVVGGKAGYNAKQFPFISKLIGNQITSNLPIISINDRIGNIDDLISESDLTVSEQTPLLLAATIGFNASEYWVADVEGPYAWDKYYPPEPEDYMDIPYYVEAAINGALAGYGATPDGMIQPSVDHVSNNMISALIGALTATAGKLMFRWIPRIQPASLVLNAQTIANLGGGAHTHTDIAFYTVAGNACINPTDFVSRWRYTCPGCLPSVGCKGITVGFTHGSV